MPICRTRDTDPTAERRRIERESSGETRRLRRLVVFCQERRRRRCRVEYRGERDRTDPPDVVRRSATCRSRARVRRTTVLAMHALIVFAAMRWAPESPSSSQQPAAPIAEGVSRAMTLDARVGNAGRSTSMFGPTGGSDHARGEIIVCSAYILSF